MGRLFNEEGEPLMTAAEARFEDYLDDQAREDAMYDRYYGDE